uniref:gibberellin 2-beta-dioxygenase 2 n=1 Tax=Erigeron canadensis TaxID=72917 RepID=UPI001CB9569D|nr:gibberellin 2-beta-dioxygenase 2 [Erigeron canadensis]
MVVLSSPSPLRTKKTRAIGIPVIDLSLDTATLASHIITACQDYGFFKLVNHGVPIDVISKMEEIAQGFFSKPASEKVKVKANPPSPFGYGCRNIGFNGDIGELEYILLQANSLAFGSEDTFNVISDHPTDFSHAVDNYINAVKGLTCGLLEILAIGLSLPDTDVFSRFIQDVDNDSCFRVNHYPGVKTDGHPSNQPNPVHRIGFGEHSDPQIFTILRSNDVPGLQISTADGLWIPVTTEPTDFCVFVGDALEVMTNGRFKSVRHRVMANMSSKSRVSMMYFAAPALNEWISPIPQMISPGNIRLYKSFTWNEYKKAAYSLRLGDQRIDRFKCHSSLC